MPSQHRLMALMTVDPDAGGRALAALLAEHRGSAQAAAKAAGVHVRTMFRWLARYPHVRTANHDIVSSHGTDNDGTSRDQFDAPIGDWTSGIE